MSWMDRREMTEKMWPRNLKERDQLQDLGVDGSIILKCILKK
jgi:hypothetical protein